MKKTAAAVLLPEIDRIIVTLREQKVILDADLAAIYGTPTFRFNEAVRRNLFRFPEDFMFRLTKEEWAKVESLRSQFAILKPGRGQHRKYLPYAFTEHGALMAANILNSPRAITMSVYLIRAFVRMREGLLANAAILKRLAEIDKSLLTHDMALRDIYQKLRPLLAPPPIPAQPEIGFHAGRKKVI
ncbi:MAG: ORF6N domain-containing protein [Verrucomicrobiota bacterium]|jgi:hypothetical protein